MKQQSYEHAPATELLATRCLCCGRQLLDAASVEAGVGPVCRKRYGYTAISNDVRVRANALIHEAARDRCSNERREEIARELEDLGADLIGGKIRDRFMAPVVRIHPQVVTFGQGEWEQEIDALVLKTKAYDLDFNETFKASVDWRDRSIAKTPNGKFAGWAFKPSARRAVWTIIRTYYPGEIIETQNGRKVIPELDAVSLHEWLAND